MLVIMQTTNYVIITFSEFIGVLFFYDISVLDVNSLGLLFQAIPLYFVIPTVDISEDDLNKDLLVLLYNSSLTRQSQNDDDTVKLIVTLNYTSHLFFGQHYLNVFFVVKFLCYKPSHHLFSIKSKINTRIKLDLDKKSYVLLLLEVQTINFSLTLLLKNI